MIVYGSIFNLLILLRYSLSGRPRSRVKLYPLMLCVLFLFSAFRFEVGCDWSGYLNQWALYENMPFALALLDSEPTWVALMKGVQYFDFSYPWLNVISSAIFFLGVHVLARRQPDPLGFLVLLFPVLIINMPMSAVKQGVSIGFICIAFSAFIDKKLFWFTAWTLFASTIHNSAIIFILLCPLVGGEYTKKRLLLASFLAAPGALVLLSGGAAEQALGRYVGSGVEAAGAIFRVGLLMATGFSYFLILRSKWKHRFFEDYKLVSVGALIMCATIVLVPFSSVIADRVGYYLIPIQTMIFARIPYMQIQKVGPFFSIFPYLILSLVLLVWSLLSSHFAECYAPYQTWIFGMPASTVFAY